MFPIAPSVLTRASATAAETTAAPTGLMEDHKCPLLESVSLSTWSRAMHKKGGIRDVSLIIWQCKAELHERNAEQLFKERTPIVKTV